MAKKNENPIFKVRFCTFKIKLYKFADLPCLNNLRVPIAKKSLL